MTKEEILKQINAIFSEIALCNANRYIRNHHKELYDEIHIKTSFLDKFKNDETTIEGGISLLERIYCVEHDLKDRPKCQKC